jgi:hypothetical protein
VDADSVREQEKLKTTLCEIPENSAREASHTSGAIIPMLFQDTVLGASYCGTLCLKKFFGFLAII